MTQEIQLQINLKKKTKNPSLDCGKLTPKNKKKTDWKNKSESNSKKLSNVNNNNVYDLRPTCGQAEERN